MSYHKTAERVNKNLREFLNANPMVDDYYIEKLFNTIMEFGQTAKFRYRSNAAYDNYCRLVFDGFADIARQKLLNKDFEVLQVVNLK